MSNRRFILILLVGCLIAGATLAWLTRRAESVASLATRTALVSLPREELCELSFSNGTGAPFVVRREENAWRLTAPFAADVDEEAVARVLDELVFAPIGDTHTDAELRRLGRISFLRDFQLDPPRAAVTASVPGGRFEHVALGRLTPSGQEVYARVEGLGNVFTVPISVLRALPASPAVLRRRTLFHVSADDVTAVELRVPDAPVARIQREGGRWTFVKEPGVAVHAKVLSDLLRRLAAARIADYLTSGDVSAAKAAAPSYGIEPETGLAVTLQTSSGVSEQIVFGNSAPAAEGAATNLVFALVQNGTAVVSVEADLAEACRTGAADLRDLRAFPVALEDTASVSLATPEGAVYALERATNGHWRLSAPIDAPADGARVEKLLSVLASLRTPDVASADDRRAVRVTLAHAATNVTVAVSAAALSAASPFDELCSRHVFSFDPATVKGVTLRTASGEETALVRDAVRDAWGLAPRSAGAVARGALSVQAVKRFVAALSDVNAQGVEMLAASEEDRVRCGVKGTGVFLSAAVDFSDAAVARRNFIVGAAAPGGGRYASVGGSDAIFIVSRQTVEALSASLVE